MTYFYYNNQGAVKMRSEERIEEHGTLTEIERTVDVQDLEENPVISIKNNQLTLEDRPRLQEENKQEGLEMQKRQLKEKLKNKTVTLDDITNFITNYL